MACTVADLYGRSTWQVLIAGTWETSGDARQLDDRYRRGMRTFSMTSHGQTYEVELEGSIGNLGTQTNKKTGQKHRLRLWPPLPDENDQAVEPDTPLTPYSRSGGDGFFTARDLKRGLSVAWGMPTCPVERLRFFVWRRNEWHPVSSTQEEQIRDHLRTGEEIFEIHDGARRWRIETTTREGWVQINIPSEKRRSLKFVESLESPLSFTEGIAHSQAVSSKPSRKPCLPSHRGTNGKLPLIDALRAEWKAMSNKKYSMTQADLVAAWKKANSESGTKDEELLTQSAADVFLKVNLSRSKRIDETEWLHYRLLENQAPSFYAMAQVNEKMLGWLHVDAGVLKEFVDLFESKIEGDGMRCGRMTSQQMLDAAEAWIHKAVRYKDSDHVVKNTSEHLCDLLDGRVALEEDEDLTYYDFLNHMLGRKKASVQLYQYDLSQGNASWLSPLLLGQQLEGIWHTGVVVNGGKEYWYGGKLFESPPGETPFGKPTKIVDLPGDTMRTREDLWSFIARELTEEFNVDTYDVLTNNCNHFSDAVCKFLINQHIPQDVLRMPERVMTTWTAQLLRPLLNKILGRFECEQGKAGPGTTVCSPDDRAIQSEWSQVTNDGLVVYEYEEGWTCIARVAEKFNDVCDLQWLDARAGEIRLQRAVPRHSIQALRGTRSRSIRRNIGGGGIFSACYQLQNQATTSTECTVSGTRL